MGQPSLRQIRASAGSGKTTRLTAQYIDELKNLTPGANSALQAAGILAVTFTNAAADEMRKRVIDRLKAVALGQEPAGAWAAQWLDIFFSEPAALNIRTIDSLLHQIVRASALELNISPDYETGFDAQKMLAPHVELVLEQARQEGPARERLRAACDAALLLKDGNGFASSSNILEPLVNALEAALTGKFAGLADAAQIEALEAGIEASLTQAASQLLDAAASFKLEWKGADKNTVTRFANGNFTNEAPAIGNRDAAGALFKSLPGEAETAVSAAFAEFKKYLGLYYQGCAILKKGRAEKPFIDLAHDVAAAFRNDPLQRNMVPQALVSGWARGILTAPDGVSDALCRLGSRLRNFLVDEFQDTSTDQWLVLRPLILEALAHGGQFTWVGDVKQSIYGWRGGNPLLFDAPFSDSELTCVAAADAPTLLASNWRSRPAVVTHNNAIFDCIAQNAQAIAATFMDSKAPPDLVADVIGRLRSSYADARQQCGRPDGEPGFVCAEAIPGGKAEETRAAIAARLCEILLDDIGPRRPWSDVLVLVRSNDDAADLAALLADNRIPVITENGLRLADNALIVQSVALLSFLNNPDDDVAFWTVLAGSIFAGAATGLDAQDLHGWAAARKGALWREFRQDFPDVWNRTFGLFYGKPVIMTAYDTVAEWYRLFSVEERFRDDETMLRRFMETLHLAENAGMASVAAFLDYWQENGDKEKAPMPENMDAVRVMTIHKSKGLQAPLVMIPVPDYNIKASDDLAVLNVEGLAVAATLRKDMGRPWHEDIARQGLEALNLVYVAFTRPCEELYLLFPEKKIGKQKNTRDALNCIWKQLGWQLPYSFGSRKAAAAGHAPRLMRIEQPTADCAALPGPDWEPMAWMPRLRIYHAEPALKELSAKQRGTIMHACLEFMDSAGDVGRAAEIALKNGLSSCGIALPEAERHGILKALEWFGKQAGANEWLRQGLREQPLVTAEGQLLRPDLIARMPWGLLVVDYKSGEPAPEHGEQLRGYMRVLAQSDLAYGAIRGLLVYLDRQEFMKVCLADNISLAKPPADPAMRLTADLPPLP